MLALSNECLFLNQSFIDWKQAIQFAGQILFQQGYIKYEYIDKMIARQERLSVYIGNFVALVHGEKGSDQWILNEGICFIQVPDGVNFGTKEMPKIATVIFAVAFKEKNQLQVLQDLAFLCSDIHQVAALSDAKTKEELQRIFENKE